jgi:hypothetical protein
MARFLYDVNKTTRYIDIHKSFQGGLKTVDTDDALKDFYLREAENVSLSEFNFVEKRYGLHKLQEHMPWSSLTSTSSIVQGYFEYYTGPTTVHKIIAIEGRFYVDQGSGFEEVNFFTIPEGSPFFDLLPLGIYTEDVVNTITTFSSFNNDIPRFFFSTVEMNLPENVGAYEDQVAYVFQNTTHYIFKPGGWTLLNVGGGNYPAAGFVQGEFYYDERTQTSYRWNNASGKSGLLTINENIYKADFQTTRPIDGVRLDDKLYIATGTYPVYYKGDGKIYVLPQYQMSDLDVQNLGYDLNSLDLEEALYGEKELEESSSYGPTFEGETLSFKNTLERPQSIAIKENLITPIIPYIKPSISGTTTFNTAWHLYNNSTGDFYGTFDSETTPAGYTTPYGKLVETVSGSNKWYPQIIKNEYIVKIKIQRKLSGVLTSLYEDVEGTETVIIDNNVSGNGGIPTGLSQTLDNIVFSLKNTDSGNFDYRVKISLYKKGYKGTLVSWYTYTGDGAAFYAAAVNNRKWNITSQTFASAAAFVTWLNANQNGLASLYGAQNTDGLVIARGSNGSGVFFYAMYNTLVQDFVEGEGIQYPFLANTTSEDNITEILLSEANAEFLNVWTTPEKLVDFLEDPYPTLKVHTCNRITEHNGRLCLFGSTTHPDWLFFSTAGAKNYFPYGYALQFTNELVEPVNSVTKFMNILVVQSPSYTWGIKGDVPLQIDELEGQTYRKITINPTIGCIAPNSVKNVRNQLYFLSKEGVFTLRALYAEDSRYNVDPIDRNIYNIVPRDTDAISTYFDDQYWLHFPQSGETLRYYVDKKAWVRDKYEPWNIFGGVHKYINTDGTLRFITQLSQLEDGNAVKIFDVEVDYSLPTDLTKEIVSKVTTSFLNQSHPFHPKNYKEAKFDFAIQNEYNTSTQALPISDYAETVNYVEFKATLIDRHFYSITFEPDEITGTPNYSVEINETQVLTGTITEDGDNLEPIRFLSNKNGLVTVKITMTSAINTTNMSVDSIKLYDSTYDHTVTFNTLVFSEEGTLNIDAINSYTEADVAVPIDLGTRTGNWTFGTSNFGNVVVAVKTVKLSGRGYNSKISIIEDSKSKWTLESLGITYKMKKARTR